MANDFPVMRHTLGKELELILILSSVDQFLHQFYSSLSSIIYNQQVPHKVSGLDVGGEAFPERNWSFQPGEIFYLEKIEQHVGLDPNQTSQSLLRVEVSRICDAQRRANTFFHETVKMNIS